MERTAWTNQSEPAVCPLFVCVKHTGPFQANFTTRVQIGGQTARASTRSTTPSIAIAGFQISRHKVPIVSLATGMRTGLIVRGYSRARVYTVCWGRPVDYAGPWTMQ
jgi:hypothetical protein